MACACVAPTLCNSNCQDRCRRVGVQLHTQNCTRPNLGPSQSTCCQPFCSTWRCGNRLNTRRHTSSLPKRTLLSAPSRAPWANQESEDPGFRNSNFCHLSRTSPGQESKCPCTVRMSCSSQNTDNHRLHNIRSPGNPPPTSSTSQPPMGKSSAGYPTTSTRAVAFATHGTCTSIHQGTSLHTRRSRGFFQSIVHQNCCSKTS